MKHADGSTGEHCTYEQTNQVLKQKGFGCEASEFYAVTNMLWSDYCKVAEKFGVNNVDFWAAMAYVFLADADAAENMITLYHEYIAKYR